LTTIKPIKGRQPNKYKLPTRQQTLDNQADIFIFLLTYMYKEIQLITCKTSQIRNDIKVEASVTNRELQRKFYLIAPIKFLTPT